MIPRRQFLWTTLIVGTSAAMIRRGSAAAPTANPAARYSLDWIARLPWSCVVNLAEVAGASDDERLERAQQQLGAQGGVVYLPAGVYRFRDSIRLRDGVILRGEPPERDDARRDDYRLGTRLEFPAYRFQADGDGEPIESAFKVIELANPENGGGCGLVHLHIEHARIHWREADGFQSRPGRLVYGCVVRHAATADPAVPDRAIGQHGWQRFTARHSAAIEIEAAGDVLVANNRLAPSSENFVMNGYRLKHKNETIDVDGVVFDYDNRPGIYVNHFSLGGPGGDGPDGTPDTHPHGFRRGIVIADNFIWCTGRMAIGFAGDGVVCRGNVIRFAKDVWRPTTTGRQTTTGASTNDNRAVEMRGWRWRLEDNDYEVHRNWAYDRKYLINDGEGLMHEDHCNSTVLDSALIGNRGNAYISIYKTGGIDGLVVERNQVPNIMVVADRNKSRHPIRRVRIAENVTNGSIHVGGEPSQDVVVERNRCTAPGGTKLLNQANAVLRDNSGFIEDRTPPTLRR